MSEKGGRFGVNANDYGPGEGNEPQLAAQGSPTEVRAVAFISCETLLGTEQWGWLYPFIFYLALSSTFVWLWLTEDLSTERKGTVGMGILLVIAGAVFLSKRVRDEQRADLLTKYAQRTRFYHPLIAAALRGTEAYRNFTRAVMAIGFIALFGAIWWMPINTSIKWSLAKDALYLLGFTFMYAKGKRDADEALTSLEHLRNSH